MSDWRTLLDISHASSTCHDGSGRSATVALVAVALLVVAVALLVVAVALLVVAVVLLRLLRPLASE